MIEEATDWKRKNSKYYERNFKSLKEKSSSAFNWPACIFGPIYCAYRKMYALALLLIILDQIAMLGLDYLVYLYPEHSFMLHSICVTIYLAFFIWFGFNANRIYYNFIQDQVRKGFNEIKKYKQTSLLLATVLLLDPYAFTAPIFSLVALMLFATVDYYSNPHISKTRKEFKVTDNEIIKYINRTSKEHTFSSKITWVLYLFVVLEISSMIYIQNNFGHLCHLNSEDDTKENINQHTEQNMSRHIDYTNLEINKLISDDLDEEYTDLDEEQGIDLFNHPIQTYDPQKSFKSQEEKVYMNEENIWNLGEINEVSEQTLKDKWSPCLEFIESIPLKNLTEEDILNLTFSCFIFSNSLMFATQQLLNQNQPRSIRNLVLQLTHRLLKYTKRICVILKQSPNIHHDEFNKDTPYSQYADTTWLNVSSNAYTILDIALIHSIVFDTDFNNNKLLNYKLHNIITQTKENPYNNTYKDTIESVDFNCPKLISQLKYKLQTINSNDASVKQLINYVKSYTPHNFGYSPLFV